MWPRWLLLTGFVLLIFGAKLRLLSMAGSDLPTWDQWDSQSEIVFRPWLEGRLTAANIFQPHNEHQIATAKLYTLGLLALNGQWDSLVETSANAAIHTGFALALLLLARRWLQGFWLGAFGALLALLFTIPFSWENTLVGFQVQFYFLLWFALLHIWLTLRSDRFSVGWGLGQLCALLGLASMASGFFSDLAIIAVLGLRLLRERRWTAQQITSVAIAIALSVAGALLKPHIAGHDELMAHDAGEFVSVALHMLAWPGTWFFPWSLILIVPAVLFTIRCFIVQRLTGDDAILLGLLAWAVLQIVAAAYARGGSGIISSRYMDLFAINVALGFACISRVISWSGRRAIAIVWLGLAAASAAHEGVREWRQSIVAVIRLKQHCEENVRAYLHTNDPSHLLNKPFQDIPYPSAQELIKRLASPAIRGVLPASVRLAVPIFGGTDATSRTSTLSAAIAPLPAYTPALVTRDRHEPFTWRSAKQPAMSLPVLRFRIAGDLGPAHPNLRLVVKSDRSESEVNPDATPGPRWKTVNVFRPSGEWWIEVSDKDPTGWFGFSAPIELGRLSWAARKLLKHHAIVLVTGGLCICAGAVAWGRRRRDFKVASTQISTSSLQTPSS